MPLYGRAIYADRVRIGHARERRYRAAAAAEEERVQCSSPSLQDYDTIEKAVESMKPNRVFSYHMPQAIGTQQTKPESLVHGRVVCIDHWVTRFISLLSSHSTGDITYITTWFHMARLLDKLQILGVLVRKSEVNDFQIRVVVMRELRKYNSYYLKTS